MQVHLERTAAARAHVIIIMQLAFDRTPHRLALFLDHDVGTHDRRRAGHHERRALETRDEGVVLGTGQLRVGRGGNGQRHGQQDGGAAAQAGDLTALPVHAAVRLAALRYSFDDHSFSP
ncbi:hypothetical protein LP420_11770 [Massilia sp. B-10]|nr:hypothetical protein LP420_11770 [Massilia sp. B-10]